jgi:hypothetical protein
MIRYRQGLSIWDMGHRLGHPPYRYVHPGYRYGIIWVIEMGDDRIDTDILGIDMGYLVTLPTTAEAPVAARAAISASSMPVA